MSPIKKRTWGPFTEVFEASGSDHAMSISWSQSGEDLALQAVLGEVKNGSYIDIGAHHPIRFSVTRHLYNSGWRGVNVDGNLSLIPAFLKERPEDVSICAVVGCEPEYTFSIFTEPAISTHNDFWKNQFLNEGQEIARSESVKGVSLRQIYDKYFPNGCIDFLNIDAEGSDLDVFDSMFWESLDSSRFPVWILLESFPPLETSIKAPAVAKAIALGYEIWLILPMSVLLRYSFAPLLIPRWTDN
jgi:hypothetical protein